MVLINRDLIPSSLTLGKVEELQNELKKCKTILDWKKAVKKFATENGLTDQEAIAAAANFK
jgi:hypothetical protein